MFYMYLYASQHVYAPRVVFTNKFLDNGMDSQLRPSFWKDVIAYLGP